MRNLLFLVLLGGCGSPASELDAGPATVDGALGDAGQCGRVGFACCAPTDPNGKCYDVAWAVCDDATHQCVLRTADAAVLDDGALAPVVDAAVAGSVDAAPPIDAAVPPSPDAAPSFLPFDWTGTYAISWTFLPGASTCTEPAYWIYDRLALFDPAWDPTGAAFYTSTLPLTMFAEAATEQPDHTVAVPAHAFSAYTWVDATTLTQVSANSFTAPWVRHDTSPGNPDAPCYWTWTLQGTKL